MSKINQPLTQLVKSYLPEQVATLQQLLALQQTRSSLPTLAVYGVYSAGKSSLLNALTENIHQEYFATSVIPETRQLKALDYQGVRYLDTPGLDVNFVDTNTAQEGAFQADMLVFTHSLKTGVVQQPEIEAMKELVAAHQNTQHFLVALTAAESVNNKPDLIAGVTQQFNEFIPHAKVFAVSNTSFIKGRKENKANLTQHSGIPALQNQIIQTAAEVAKTLQQLRTARKIALEKQLKEAVQAAILFNSEQRNKEQAKLKSFQQTFINSVQEKK